MKYDAPHRHQAATRKNRTWFRVNPSLFYILFTGKAQQMRSCDLCLAVSQSAKECSLSADPDRGRAVIEDEGSGVGSSSICPKRSGTEYEEAHWKYRAVQAVQ